MDLSAKVRVLLVKWPRWCFETLRGNKTEVIAEMASLDKQALGQAGDDKNSSSFPVELVLTTLSCLLLLLRKLDESAVDQFVSIAITFSAAALVMSFLFGVSDPVLHSFNREKRASPLSVILDLFILSCFFVSTVPFTLPWILAFFFPYEFLLVASIFTIGNELVKLIHRVVASRESDMHEYEMDKSYKPSSSRTTTESKLTSQRRRHLKPTLNPLLHDTTSDQGLKNYLTSLYGREWCGAFILVEAGLVLVSSALSLVWEGMVHARFPKAERVSWVNESSIFVWHSENARHDWKMLFLSLFLSVLSTSMFLQAFWLQYAAGGRWLHFNSGWSFFQPFRGGTTFVSLQLCAWCLYGLCLSLSAERMAPVILTCLAPFESIVPIAVGTLHHMGSLARLTGLDTRGTGSVAILYILADVFLVFSLPHFQGKGAGRRQRAELKPYLKLRKFSRQQSDSTTFEANAVLEDQSPFWSALDDAVRTLMLSLVLFSSVKPELILTLFSVCCMSYIPDSKVVLAVLCTSIALYLPTYFGKPSLTGARTKFDMQTNKTSAKTSKEGSWSVFLAVARHFKLTVVRDTPKAWDSSNAEYIFGYHPHGLIPAGASYLKNTKQWTALFPGIYPATLSASITHVIPILRDLNQWTGSLEVSKRGFWSGLDRFRGVMLVPGGQHEMLLLGSEHQEAISVKHRGFVRLALVRAAHRPNTDVFLVPTFAFGEKKTVRNVSIPLSIQRWFVDRLRTNVAFFPIGRYGLPSVPDRGPVTIVVGEPIKVPVLCCHSKSPTEEQVNLLHRLYYSRLKEMFDKFKVYHQDGYDKMEMVFEPPLEVLSNECFAREWDKIKSDGEPYDEKKSARFLAAVDHEKEVDFPWQEFLVAVVVVAFFLFGPFLVNSKLLYKNVNT